MMKFITEHYIFSYKKESFAAENIELIAKEQEECYEKICKVLMVNYSEKINYYLLDTPEEVGKLYGGNDPINGFAVWGENKIYVVYNEEIKCIGPHEDAHLISFVINAPKSYFIVEGLAMYFDEKWWDIDNDIWTAYYKDIYKELSISKLLENEYFESLDCEITYPISGAFTKYLIDKYGIDKYLLLYKYEGTNFQDIILSIYGRTIEVIENAFWNEILKINYDENFLKNLIING